MSSKKTNNKTPRRWNKTVARQSQALTSELRPTKFAKIKKIFTKRPLISEITREPTAGGMIFRPTSDNTDIEVLLIQDSKNRWTIPKGHIELGETPKQTAIREIGEEVGLKSIDILSWLGKVDFQYRRENRLVLMNMHIYLVQLTKPNEKIKPEEWIKKAQWFPFAEAIDKIEYDDIAKLMLLGRNKLRTGELNNE
jgi:8-oxo-dGTP pyrophosphatase MutT (NUDIX family)